MRYVQKIIACILFEYTSYFLKNYFSNLVRLPYVSFTFFILRAPFSNHHSFNRLLLQS